VYLKNPVTAGIIGNMSSLTIFLGLIAYSIRRG
jgi:hypothetical protein